MWWGCRYSRQHSWAVGRKSPDLSGLSVGERHGLVHAARPCLCPCRRSLSVVHLELVRVLVAGQKDIAYNFVADSSWPRLRDPDTLRYVFERVHEARM